MKQKRRLFSLLLAIIILVVYLIPSTSFIYAASISDYKTVTTFVYKNFPVVNELSQGVQYDVL